MKKALGRGLSTLLPARPHSDQEPNAPPHAQPESSAPTALPVGSLTPNPFQPRTHFDTSQLEELAQSIRVDGIIQPIIVRPAGDDYQIIAGERRWRAAQLAGLAEVPVHIQIIPDDRMLEVALVENIQREDLNAIESAIAFQRLHEQLGFNHEEIGRRTGKDRATISNSIRLLQLPEDLQRMVAERILSPGHARALLKIDDPDHQRSVARQAAAEQWSVRKMEAETNKPTVNREGSTTTPKLDPNVRAAIDELERALGTRVRIVEKTKGNGKIEIDFYSPEDLDRIYTAIAGDRG